MTTRLSALVADGLERMAIVLPGEERSTAVGQLAAAAGGYFSDRSDSDRVGVLLTNDRPTVEVIVGSVLAGVELVSLPLPGRGADLAAYAGFIRHVCRVQGLAEVVVADQYADLLASSGVSVRPHTELARRPLAAPSDHGFALVQFTSGSTGAPRPILVDDERLGANVGAILETLRPRPGDVLVSWLPLAHDMGLIGMLLTGIAAGGTAWTGGAEIVLLDPPTFLRSPARWLEALDRWRGSFTAAPDFGYRLALRRPASTTLDLSRLRCAIVGGEIVRADTLDSFATALAGHGLDRRALCPAYGMAEAGLAVTMTPLEEEWRVEMVSTGPLADGVVERGANGDDTTSLVASGRPLPGYSVTAAPVARAVARIRINGPSLGVDGTTGEELADPAHGYETGDVGFAKDGWLFVCGRTDDYIVAHGRNLYAPALEVAVGGVAGVRSGRVAAVALPSGEWSIVAELHNGARPTIEEQRGLRREIVRSAVEVGAARPDTVVLVEPGGLALTSSGKLQRNRIRAALAKGELRSV